MWPISQKYCGRVNLTCISSEHLRDISCLAYFSQNGFEFHFVGGREVMSWGRPYDASVAAVKGGPVIPGSGASVEGDGGIQSKGRDERLQ